MDSLNSFTEQSNGKEFICNTGSWICHLTRRVDSDISSADRVIFYFQFNRIDPVRNWSGPEVRTLRLCTSDFTFAIDPEYGPWLQRVIEGFLNTEGIDGVREAFQVERAL